MRNRCSLFRLGSHPKIHYVHTNNRLIQNMSHSWSLAFWARDTQPTRQQRMFKETTLQRCPSYEGPWSKTPRFLSFQRLERPLLPHARCSLLLGASSTKQDFGNDLDRDLWVWLLDQPNQPCGLAGITIWLPSYLPRIWTQWKALMKWSLSNK